ncbi:MAG: c-type cytochrome [Hylemonella sp.]|uniref:c-type cytochrome n=1 Tax=Hylemonella sp. TaxID=2066020 RepID=UPI0022C87FDF|nr:c-type cytochrome [Hylemonella sp.]MCZ8252486.1 c-type cytochrome [Hylemonella sp.]
MKNLSLTLSSLLVASATVFSAHAQELKGDAKAGEAKVAMCIGCHGIPGYQASFPEVYRVPMISGQNAKFIASALTAYQKGERKHPSMRAIAESLSEQDIADISAFYEGHGKTAATAVKAAPAPSAKVAELLNKGGCIACHGDNFNKPVDPSYPKVGGQPADYLFVALKSYKVEGQANWGRANGIMGGIAKQFSNAELKELAGYISSLPPELKTVPQRKFR